MLSAARLHTSCQQNKVKNTGKECKQQGGFVWGGGGAAATTKESNLALCFLFLRLFCHPHEIRRKRNGHHKTEQKGGASSKNRARATERERETNSGGSQKQTQKKKEKKKRPDDGQSADFRFVILLACVGQLVGLLEKWMGFLASGRGLDDIGSFGDGLVALWISRPETLFFLYANTTKWRQATHTTKCDLITIVTSLSHTASVAMPTKRRGNKNRKKHSKRFKRFKKIQKDSKKVQNARRQRGEGSKACARPSSSSTTKGVAA